MASASSAPTLSDPLCETIEAKAGGMAMFMNGAQGGMVTADNRDLSQSRDPVRAVWDDARRWDECLRIGRLMADEAIRIVGGASAQPDPGLWCDAIDVRFPVESKLMWAVVVGSPLKYPHNDDQSVTARINLVNLGDAQILTIPGEALPNIGFYLKRKMKGKHNLLFGLTNDAFGYILTKVDFQSFPPLRLRLADLTRRDDRRDPHRKGARLRRPLSFPRPLRPRLDE